MNLTVTCLKLKSAIALFQIAMKNVASQIAIQNVNVQRSQDPGKRISLDRDQGTVQGQAMTNVANQDANRWKRTNLLRHQWS